MKWKKLLPKQGEPFTVDGDENIYPKANMFYTLLSALLLTAPLVAHGPSQAHHSMITTEQLKTWYDQKKPMVIIDARSLEYFDGQLLPNAKWLSSESTEKEIQGAVPDKNSLVVVYCAGPQCPASGWLYDKLSGMGYRNIYEYHEGIEGWTEKGYPTTKK